MLRCSSSQHSCYNKMGEKPVLLGVFIIVAVVGLITNSLASGNIHSCPHSFANHTQDAFGLSNNTAYVQLGLPHKIPCRVSTSIEYETLWLFWYKLYNGTTVFLKAYRNKHEYPFSERYSLAPDFGLLINGIEESDGGKYLCKVHWLGMEYTQQTATINIQVIGHTLPHGIEAVSEASSQSSLERGRRHKLQCGCASQTRDAQDSVVYWSRGEGDSTDTQIIGARFSDGATLQIQHGADYSIGSDASLAINTLNDVQDTQRFWCHVFKSNGTLHSCSTDVLILQVCNPNIVLKATPTEFYLPQGYQQVLPCRSWTPGDVMCGVQWIHELSQRVVLNYNLSADIVEADSDYDLASDFGLLIESVKPTHAGRFTCYIEDGPEKAPLKGALDARVIGDSFPASAYQMFSSVTVKRGHGETLPCECAQENADASVLAVFWSIGVGIYSDTYVIAARLSNGSLLNYRSNGHDISSDWSLTVNSLTYSSHFWCHVFRSHGTLSNCRTSVSIMQEAGESKGITVTAILGSLEAVAVLLLVLLCLSYRRKRSSTNSYQMGEWPETDKRTYTHPELLHNTPQGCARLEEEQHSDFFIGSTNGNGNVILQGRSGSGKTNFLFKLRHDLQNTKPVCCTFLPKIVFLTKALHISEAVTNINLNISYFLHLSDAVILVDDCNSVKDTEEVLKATKGLSRCQLVMTTRSARLAQDISQKYSWRHVTITGFSASSARTYAKSNYPEPQLQFIASNNLFESIASLPGFLKRLYEYRGLERQHSVSDVVSGILKSMFCTLCNENCLDEYGNGDELQQKQNAFLAKCGEVALRAMLDHSESEEELSKVDFVQSFRDGNDVLKDGIKMGLLKDENIEPKTDDSNENKSIPQESNRQQEKSNGEVSNSQAQMSSVVNLSEKLSTCAYTCSPQLSNIESGSGEGCSPQVSNIEYATREGSGPQAPNIENLNAVSQSQYSDTIINSNIEEASSPQDSIVDNSNTEASNPQQSNMENSDEEASILQEVDMANSNKEAPSPQEFDIHVNISTGEELSSLLTGHDATVRFSLEIFRDFCAGKQLAQNPQEWMEKINVYNIEQLANAMVFASAEKFGVARAIVQHLIEIVERNWKKKGSRSLKDEIQLQKLTELCLEVNFNGRWNGQLNNEINLLFREKQMRFVGISSHRLRLFAYYLKCKSKTTHSLKLRSVVLFRIDENLSWAEFKQYVEYLFPGALEAAGSEQVATVFQLKKSQESQKDKRMLHNILQSMCLQELIDTQSGECHSSTSATEFARYLPKQQHLEKIVLLGPVLGSQQIRDLLHTLDRPKHLKQFDLRLNTQIDDRAFEKIMETLSACTTLTDLRLSLYRVTTQGFEMVKAEMKNVATLLKRLQTLYLLHGSLTQSFGKFLTDIIKYMDNLQQFHVSALVASDDETGIPEEVVEEIRRQMPTLIELIVDTKDVFQRHSLPQSEEGAIISSTSNLNFHVAEKETLV